MLTEDESQIRQREQLCPLGTQEQRAVQAFTEKREIATSRRISLTYPKCVLSLRNYGSRNSVCVFFKKISFFLSFPFCCALLSLGEQDTSGNTLAS